MKISTGDLVTRKYDISIKHVKYGLVVGINNNGYIVINWGGRIEDFWDAYDLDIVSHAS